MYWYVSTIHKPWKLELPRRRWRRKRESNARQSHFSIASSHIESDIFYQHHHATSLHTHHVDLFAFSCRVPFKPA